MPSDASWIWNENGAVTRTEWEHYKRCDMDSVYPEHRTDEIVPGITRISILPPWDDALVVLLNETVKLDIGATIEVGGIFKALREMDARFKSAVMAYNTTRIPLRKINRRLDEKDPAMVQTCIAFDLAYKAYVDAWSPKADLQMRAAKIVTEHS